MSGLRKVIPPVLGVGAFIEQTTSGDRAYAQSTGYWDKLNGTGKAKLVLGDLASRITFGTWAPFPDVAGPVKPTLNLGNVMNKWTGIGIAGIGYSWAAHSFGGKYLPEGRLAGKAGGAALAAGILGGLLDDPPAYGTGNQSSNLNSAGNGAITRSTSGGMTQSSGLNGR
jgi:hypothetical protein